jgi:hypothetical protein
MPPIVRMRVAPSSLTMERSVTGTYEIWLGPNRIAVLEAGSALLALIEYLRGEGVADGDIVRLGQHEVSWRGAVYRAVDSAPEQALLGS